MAKMEIEFENKQKKFIRSEEVNCEILNTLVRG